MFEKLQQDLLITAIAFISFGVLDVFIKNVLGWFRDDKNGRYFTLHVICNAFVTIVAFPDVIRVYTDPLTAHLVYCNTSSIAVILALHLYHIAAYQPLVFVDWLHHIVMVIVMLPCAYAVQPGAFLAHGAFFASGLPGGIDYLMLVLVKAGYIESITEKRWNDSIQLWCRAPGCLFHALFSWICICEIWKHGPSYLPARFVPDVAVIPCILVVALTFFWNGLYFLKRVLVSTARHEMRLKAKSQ